ncbi:MAG: hypothetical protein JRJ12_16770 [Deltaproteobacteria bacterium]|nr:hypothetical protein [Deltaproteobacteria bacterium]MBW2072798.1 hypothetical protein [Deltaproteobacteria bacterium]
MARVKTFTTTLEIFRAMSELEELDERVNQFIKESNIDKVIWVSDTCTTDDQGATIGLIRVLAYE